MLSCTGRALVCLYCTRPNTAPMAQITMPSNIRVMPADAAQTVELDLGEVGDLDVRFAGENASGGQ